MPQITIIIPVYNAESYLSRCVDSIISQTFSDFNIVLVDDGSSDNCPAMCDKYSTEDSRIYVHHQKNGGPSKARNSGIEWALHHTNCRYLVFIDSDDCIHPQYLELLYRGISENNTNISMCTHRYISLNESIGKPETYHDVPVVCAHAEDLMLEHNSFNYIWGKMFSVDCFREIRFPENISFGEDNLILFKIMFAGSPIAFIDIPLYNYFYNPTGITKSGWTPQALQCFDGINAQLEFYKANGYTRAYKKEIELYIQQCAYQIHRILGDREHRKENRRYLITLQKNMRCCLKENPAFTLAENSYWYEALYPYRASLKHMASRMNANFNELGLCGTLQKITAKIQKR